MESLEHKLAGMPVAALYALLRSVVGPGPYERTHNKARAVSTLLETDHDVLRAVIVAQEENPTTTTTTTTTQKKEPQPMGQTPDGYKVDELQNIPAAESAPDKAAAALAALRAAMGESSVDAAQVREIVRAEMAAMPQGAPITITMPSQPDVTLPMGTDPTAARCVALIRAGLTPLLVGPAGCGKSTIARQVAGLLRVSFASASLTAGTPESELIGRILPDANGSWEYRASPFTEGYEAGNALFLFDELGAADPNMLLVVNQALANGSMHLSLRRERPCFKRADTWHAMAAANVVTGAAGAYMGQGALDASTLDRFFPLAVTYSDDYERALGASPDDSPRRVEDMGFVPQPPKDPDACRRACYQWTQECRTYIADRGLEADVVVSTRWLERAIAARFAGLSADEVRASLTLTWPRDAAESAPRLRKG